MFNHSSVLLELEENGYTVLKSIIKIDELSSNHAINEILHAALKSKSFYYSLLSNSKEINVVFSSVITSQFQQVLSPVFANHRFLAGCFYVKPAKEYSEFHLHQDISVTDEKHFTPITVWAPLVDTDETSGGMFFIKGSHKYFDNIRSHSYKSAHYSLKEIGRENVESVIVGKGDILLFNPAVWHGSFPNVHSHARGVFVCNILPDEAPFYYYDYYSPDYALKYFAPDDLLEVYLNDIRQGKPVSEMFVKNELVLYTHNKFDSFQFKKTHEQFSKLLNPKFK